MLPSLLGLSLVPISSIRRSVRYLVVIPPSVLIFIPVPPPSVAEEQEISFTKWVVFVFVLVQERKALSPSESPREVKIGRFLRLPSRC